MDVDAKSFDQDFSGFRTVIKELERRLGAIIMQVCQHAPCNHKMVHLFHNLHQVCMVCITTTCLPNGTELASTCTNPWPNVSAHKVEQVQHNKQEVHEVGMYEPGLM
jgi:hypothetical protein